MDFPATEAFSSKREDDIMVAGRLLMLVRWRIFGLLLLLLLLLPILEIVGVQEGTAAVTGRKVVLEMGGSGNPSSSWSSLGKSSSSKLAHWSDASLSSSSSKE